MMATILVMSLMLLTGWRERTEPVEYCREAPGEGVQHREVQRRGKEREDIKVKRKFQTYMKCCVKKRGYGMCQ